MTIADGFGKKITFCHNNNESGLIPHPPLIMIPPLPGKLLRSGVPQTVKLMAGDCIVEYQPFPFNSKVSFDDVARFEIKLNLKLVSRSYFLAYFFKDGPLFLYFVFSIVQLVDKILLVSGFEPLMSEATTLIN